MFDTLDIIQEPKKKIKINSIKDLEGQLNLEGILPIKVKNSPIFNKIATQIYNGWPGKVWLDRIIEIAKFINSILPYYSKIYSKNYVETLRIIAEAKNVNYINWFQNANLPKFDKVKVYKNLKEFKEKHPEGKYICPSCEGTSTDPYKCTCEGCNWKVYGLLWDLGKGITIFFTGNVKDNPIPVPVNIFKPVNLV